QAKRSRRFQDSSFFAAVCRSRTTRKALTTSASNCVPEHRVSSARAAGGLRDGEVGTISYVQRLAWFSDVAGDGIQLIAVSTFPCSTNATRDLFVHFLNCVPISGAFLPRLKGQFLELSFEFLSHQFLFSCQYGG